jgi:methylated-DNA-[protein]-cysteine S-methyltransferase
VNQINISYYKKNGIEFILGSYDGKLCLCDGIYRKNKETIYRRLQKYFNATFVENEDQIIKETKKQLDEYFINQRKEFKIPLIFAGTTFQQNVWNTLLTIDYGKTRSYKEQATILGDPNCVRAVANANGANAIGIIVPCHRIIGTNGKLTGYAGGLELKKRLLDLESK